jgi:hypothetical protein
MAERRWQSDDNEADDAAGRKGDNEQDDHAHESGSSGLN